MGGEFLPTDKVEPKFYVGGSLSRFKFESDGQLGVFESKAWKASDGV